MLHFNSFLNVILCHQAGVAGHGLMLLDGRALEKCSAASCWHEDRWCLTLFPPSPLDCAEGWDGHGAAQEAPGAGEGMAVARWAELQLCLLTVPCSYELSPPCVLAVRALGRRFCTGAGGGQNALGKSLTEKWWRGMRRKGSGSCLEGGLSNALPCNFKQILLLLWFYYRLRKRQAYFSTSM